MILGKGRVTPQRKVQFDKRTDEAVRRLAEAAYDGNVSATIRHIVRKDLLRSGDLDDPPNLRKR